VDQRGIGPDLSDTRRRLDSYSRGGDTISTRTTSIDDASLSGFHLRVTIYTTGGFFCDGYILGMIGIALSLLGPQLGLGPVWSGLIGAAALAGIFVGGIIFGWVTDLVGRQIMYVADLIVFIVGSALQFFVDGPWQLFILRFIMGVAIGADYAIGPSLLAEFVPRRHRGPLLASLNACWTVGFVAAYLVGAALTGLGPEIWRWMLASSALPAFLVLLLRLGTPESPRWLLSKGRVEEARDVIREYIDPEADIDDLAPESGVQTNYRRLFSREMRKRTAFAGLFWFCQVVPYFAIFTFLPTVLDALGIKEGVTSEIILNLFLLAGAIVGVVIMNRIARRLLLIGSFAILTVLMGLLGIFPTASPIVILSLFALFSFVIAGAANLESVYPSEIFPTEIRASGVGVAAAISRVGAAIGTFLLPSMVEGLGIGPTMLVATAVLLFGLVISWAWAPETRYLTLHEASSAPGGATEGALSGASPAERRSAPGESSGDGS
jgi:MFS transporter, putative metabolite transport protein